VTILRSEIMLIFSGSQLAATIVLFTVC
jgi:hypothetical protein